MDRIVVVTKPCELKQSIYVYVNGDTIVIETTIDKIKENIISAINKYNNITQIDICGSRTYNQKIKEDIEKECGDRIKVNLYEGE